MTYSIYYIKKGSVEVLHEQTTTIFKILNATDYFGEIAFFTKRPRCAGVRCIEFCETFTTSREATEKLLRICPDVRVKFE